MTAFECEIMTARALIFSDPATQVNLPGEAGDFRVLAGHAPVIALLRPGLVTVTGDGLTEHFVVTGGVAAFAGASLTLLADEAIPLDSFDPDDFRERIDEMQEQLAEWPPGEDRDRAAARLARFRDVLAAVDGVIGA